MAVYEEPACAQINRKGMAIIMDIFDRILELSQQGFFCSQILLIMGMEAEGKSDPELARAVGGLNEGVGYSGDLCGCLTGGCCLLSYYLGKGEAEELEDPEYRAALADFAQWFRDKTEAEYGSAKCAGITGGDVGKRLEYCPGLIADTYEKCMEMLSERGAM
jgi:hypothetical protein